MVAMTNAAMEMFSKAFFFDYDNVTRIIDEINVRKADATYPKDLRNIQARINVTTGYRKLNHKVIGALKKWLIDEGQRILDQMTLRESKSEKPVTSLLVFLDKLEVMANLRRKMGHYREAEKMYSQIFNERCYHLGPTSTKTIIAQCNYGNYFRELERFQDAEKYLSECVEVSCKELGENHTITLIAESSWGLLQKDLGNLDEAERILRNVCRKGVLCNDKWARKWDNVTRSSNLALVLVLQGKIEQGLSLLQNCYRESTKMLGPRHDYVLTDLHNLGAVMWRAGRTKEAQEYMQTCYERRSEILGEEHLRTLMTLWWYSIAMAKMGQVEKAREKLWDVMIYLQSEYKESHPRVRKCSQLHEAITPLELSQKLKKTVPAVLFMLKKKSSYMKM